MRLWALAAGVLPVLTFPRMGLSWFAWVALVPGLLLMKRAPDGREAAVRGWWFGAGFLTAALYWTVTNIGPGLLLIAVVFGLPFAAWGFAARELLRRNPLAALLVLPCGWVVIEYARSWQALGGPWALLGASQWRHPAMLGLAALGGAWLVSLAIVAVNVAVVICVSAATTYRWLAWLALGIAAALLVSGPLAYGLTRAAATPSTLRVGLVQTGLVTNPAVRFEESMRISEGLPQGLGLIVWGESSVGFDLNRRYDLVARLSALSAAKHADVLVNEDAADGDGRISKSSVLIGPYGMRGRYVKTRLVPFGEYIPMRWALGWLTHISRAAGQDRVPGTGAKVLSTDDGVTFGPLICFESAFPDLGRATVRQGAELIVYESSTSTFQDSWAPAQHASLSAVRAAETGRPVVQAALSGVTVAFDTRGRLLTWLDTGQRGSRVVTLGLPATAARTPYDRFGDYVPYFAILVTLAAAVVGYRKNGERLEEWSDPRATPVR